MQKQVLNDLIKALNGKIMENDFALIDHNLPLCDQLIELDEDIVLVTFKKKTCTFHWFLLA